MFDVRSPVDIWASMILLVVGSVNLLDGFLERNEELRELDKVPDGEVPSEDILISAEENESLLSYYEKKEADEAPNIDFSEEIVFKPLAVRMDPMGTMMKDKQ